MDASSARSVPKDQPTTPIFAVASAVGFQPGQPGRDRLVGFGRIGTDFIRSRARVSRQWPSARRRDRGPTRKTIPRESRSRRLCTCRSNRCCHGAAAGPARVPRRVRHDTGDSASTGDRQAHGFQGALRLGGSNGDEKRGASGADAKPADATRRELSSSHPPNTIAVRLSCAPRPAPAIGILGALHRQSVAFRISFPICRRILGVFSERLHGGPDVLSPGIASQLVGTRSLSGRPIRRRLTPPQQEGNCPDARCSIRRLPAGGMFMSFCASTLSKPHPEIKTSINISPEQYGPLGRGACRNTSGSETDWIS